MSEQEGLNERPLALHTHNVVGLNIVDGRELRLAKLEAEVAELREELEILASRLGYQEQRGKR